VLSPPLSCNFVAIWLLLKRFTIYRQHDIKALMLDLGMIVASRSLTYFASIVRMVVLWISLLLFRALNWREWLTPSLGFSTIYFLLGVIYYWMGRLPECFAIFKPLSYAFPTELSLNMYDYLVLLPVIITLFFFLIVLKDHFFKSVVHLRKSFQLLFFMILLTLGSFYLNKHITINHFLLCAPPFAIYLAFYFTNSKSKWIYETLYLIIIASIIYFQFV